MTIDTGAPAVRLDIAGAVATITMDRPATRNALSAELLAGLLGGLADAEAANGVRVVVLTHTGPAFCAGADLKAQDRPREAGGAPGVGRLPEMLQAIARSRLPIVARLRGHAFGGGVGLAAACDVSVATDEVLLGFTEVRLGVIPAVISVVCLPKLRRADAMELFLTGERFTAGRAAAAGLITAAVPAGELDGTVARYVDRLARGGPQAIAEAKALVYGAGQDTTADYERMAATSARLFASDEAKEGRAAFRERRPPAWAPVGSDT
jgi:methylglutaconyl-CoA hydratase